MHLQWSHPLLSYSCRSWVNLDNMCWAWLHQCSALSSCRKYQQHCNEVWIKELQMHMLNGNCPGSRDPDPSRDDNKLEQTLQRWKKEKYQKCKDINVPSFRQNLRLRKIWSWQSNGILNLCSLQNRPVLFSFWFCFFFLFSTSSGRLLTRQI